MEIDIPVQQVAADIAGIHQRYLCVILHQQRHHTAAKGIPEHDQLPMGVYSGFNGQKGLGAGQVHIIQVAAVSLGKIIDRTIFSGLNFEIHTGEKVAIVGENGSGKSTLLKILTGLLPGYVGKLLLNNTPLDPSAAVAWREQFAYAAQDPYLFGITMRENIHLGNLKASADEVDDILKQLGLDHLADRTVSLSQTELSGGEKQKISIARALLKKTPILLLDEPSNHLDADAVEWLADWLRSSPQTILYISHDPTLVELADQKIQL